MKKSVVKIGILSLVACACAGVGVANLQTAKAESTNIVYGGAYVKYMTDETDSGLRFAYNLKNSYFADVNAETLAFANENTTVGVILCPTDFLPTGFTAENALDYATAANVVNVEISADKFRFHENVTPDGTMESYAYIYDLEESMYNAEFTAVGYLTVNGETEYTVAVSECMASVAYKAVNDLEEADPRYAIAEKYLLEYDVTLKVDGETYETESVRYGNDVTTVAPEKSGYTFTGWTYENGNAFDVVTGDCTLVATYEVNKTVLTQAMVDNGTFASTIEANMAGYYVLESDLDFTDAVAAKKYSPLIGSDTKEFTGTLDGQGHSIIGYMGYPDTADVEDAKCGSRSIIYKIGKTGVVKNIGINYYSTYWYSLSPFGYNFGTVENVYSVVNYSDCANVGSGNYYSGLVADNQGTVKNCIVDITFTKTHLNSATSVGYIGAVVARNHGEVGAKVENCYAICNLSTVALAETQGENLIKNCAIYSSAIDLMSAQSANIKAENGWASFWTKETVTTSQYATAGYEKSSLKFKDTQIASAIFLSSGVESATFDELIESDMSAYYILKSDLDFSGNINSVIGAYQNQFKGTIDGNGFTISNYVVNDYTVTSQNPNWNFGRYTFIYGLATNAVIKNLAMGYQGGSSRSATWIHENYGTIENVYLKAYYSNSKMETINTRCAGMVTHNYGNLKNCIAELTYADTSLSTANLGAIVNYNMSPAVIDNCFTVCNITGATALSTGKTHTGTATNTAVYADVATLVSEQSANITAANGWASYWTVKEGVIAFGNN